jgi:cellobiose-specific phosphotransferase system component IIB
MHTSILQLVILVAPQTASYIPQESIDIATQGGIAVAVIFSVVYLIRELVKLVEAARR